MKRHKEQGIYRLKRAIAELHILEDSIDDINDELDKREEKLRVDEIRWLVNEGLQDLIYGE
jgi:hypothetical protein